MSEKKRLNRRSFLERVAGTAALVGGAGAIVTGEAAAQNYTGRTDSDSGGNADRAGYGRTGLTDSDSGNGSDRAGYGRGGGGGGGGTGLTDSDTGNGADRAGNGRGNGGGGGRTGLTASDSGGHADRAWAIFLACNAAATPMAPIEFESLGNVRPGAQLDDYRAGQRYSRSLHDFMS